MGTNIWFSTITHSRTGAPQEPHIPCRHPTCLAFSLDVFLRRQISSSGLSRVFSTIRRTLCSRWRVFRTETSGGCWLADTVLVFGQAQSRGETTACWRARLGGLSRGRARRWRRRRLVGRRRRGALPRRARLGAEFGSWRRCYERVECSPMAWCCHGHDSGPLGTPHSSRFLALCAALAEAFLGVSWRFLVTKSARSFTRSASRQLPVGNIIHFTCLCGILGRVPMTTWSCTLR